MKYLVVKSNDLDRKFFKSLMKNLLLPSLNKSQIVYINVYRKEISHHNLLVKLSIKVIANDYSSLDNELTLRHNQVRKRIRKYKITNEDIILSFQEASPLIEGYSYTEKGVDKIVEFIKINLKYLKGIWEMIFNIYKWILLPILTLVIIFFFFQDYF